jgi:hypothetical protein
MIPRRLAPILLVTVFVTGCAAKTPPVAGPKAPGALEAARTAMQDAQTAQAEQLAPEAYQRAVEQLKLAEAGTGSAAREAAIRTEGLAHLAAAEARCRTTAAATAAATATTNAAGLERTQAELKQVREENRRLDERLALLQHALDQTETELVRSKARLKGIETKAEAASAIAEARILMRRLNARSAAASLCRDTLAKAEKWLAAGNYGAAMSFALTAQEIANQALAAPPRP